MDSRRMVVVTGGSKGIGMACVEKFAEAGDRVALVDVDREAGQSVAAGFADGAVHFIHADLSDEHAARAAIREAKAVSGRLDVLVNSAGIVSGAPILDFTVEQFERLARQCAGSICAQEAARIMVEGGHGAIINMSSINARSPR